MVFQFSSCDIVLVSSTQKVLDFKSIQIWDLQFRGVELLIETFPHCFSSLGLLENSDGLSFVVCRQEDCLISPQ